MTMPKQFSPDEQIVNCLLALCNWAEVKPEHVYLDDWKCGSKACFGGHLATWKEFQAMGIRPRYRYGSPTTGLFETPREIALRFFGCESMFISGFNTPEPPHQAIVTRLEDQIARLSGQVAAPTSPAKKPK